MQSVGCALPLDTHEWLSADYGGCMSEIPRIDPNTLWWTIRGTLRELHDTGEQSQRELLIQWLEIGGAPPQVEEILCQANSWPTVVLN